jgi:hypothetical protein
MNVRDLPFEQIGELVVRARDVDSCFLQRTIELQKTQAVKVPGGAGAWQHEHKIVREFRVYVRGDKHFGEAVHADLVTAVRMAFERAQMPLPPELASVEASEKGGR